MAFILSKDTDFYSKDDSKSEEMQKLKKSWSEYRKYLESLRNVIPRSAFEFANAEWHYNPRDARCPHDAWLEEIRFGEVLKSEKFEVRPIEIFVKLLGAYHNGHLEITYKNIHSYTFSSTRGWRIADKKGEYFHGDWLWDEIRISENGFVIHEIEWEHGDWLIECEDIKAEWIPFDLLQINDMEKAADIERDKLSYQSIHENGVGAFVQSNGFINVSGSEAIMFLNGLVTNDVAKLEDDFSLLAAFPNAQGRLLSIVRVSRQGDKILFITEMETYEKVLKNLQRFTLAGDFQVNDLTEKLDTVSIRGAQSSEILAKIFGENFENAENNKIVRVKYQGAKLSILQSSREVGFDIIAPKQQAKNLLSDLLRNHCAFIGEETKEILRIENGVPKYGVDMDETTIVPELGIDGLISYNKGCYIGQEIIARIHFRGHVAKQLTGLIFDDENAEIKPNDELKSPDGKNAGRVTSVTFSPKLGKKIALAYVRYDFLSEGTELKIGEATAKVKNLPFIK